MVIPVHNSLIQPNYFYKVGMTFNNRCRIQGTGLNPIKRGRPKSNIVFEKNSSLFDNCKVNPRWQLEEAFKWVKQEALEKDQKEKIQSQLKDIERMGQSVENGKVSLHQEIRNHLRQEQQEQQRRNQRLEEIKEELKEESSHLQSHRSIRPLNLRDIPPEVGDESISVSKSIEKQH